MRYYELANMDDPQVSDLRQSRIIDETELHRRLRFISEEAENLEQAKQFLLYGKVKPAPDPWEEWAEELAESYYSGPKSAVKAALLKLRGLVGKEGRLTWTDSER